MKNCIVNNSRINKIASYIQSDVIADIGADHGYITKCLFNQNKIKFAYLTDISLKCLNKAINNLNKQTNVCFLVGDGLEPLTNYLLTNKNNCVFKSPQQIIIAGMGGKEIIKILSSKFNNYQNFVLQPQKNIIEVREFLLNNNFLIQKDEVIREGHMFYFVIKAKKTNIKHNLSKQDLLFGKTNLKLFKKDFVEFLKLEEENCLKILTNKNVLDKQEYLLYIKKALKKVERKEIAKKCSKNC